jgi:hypothetical protein
MKCAVLCNGPSRVDFQSRDGYTYVIGCNIPWFDEVDATVVLDEAIVDMWYKEPDLIKVPAYFSRHAWAWTDVGHRREFFRPRLIEMVSPSPEYDSSGHVAVTCMIKKGFKQIDVWGCDSWFDQTIVSYTHGYVRNLNPDDSKRHVVGWRNRWKAIMEGYPDVTIEFKRAK